jgi:5-hydroxyisourate hydrolase
MSSPITTHVLDTSLGRPAAGMGVTLERLTKMGWQPIGKGSTDLDGRLVELLSEQSTLVAGQYRLTFATKEYFTRLRTKTFFPAVTIEFEVLDKQDHYHVPLLVTPFGYSTYRGS